MPTDAEMLEWLRLMFVRVGDLRCEPDTRPDDMYAEVLPEWGLQDTEEWYARIGIALQWPPCEDHRWYASALEWIRQQGVVLSGGSLLPEWEPSRTQTGSAFYPALSAAVGAPVVQREGEPDE